MRRTRIVIVTAGLVVAGAVFGTIAGTLVIFTWGIWESGLDSLADGLVMSAFFGLFFGGALGAVLGPLAGWTLLRRVPLWLAVGGTTLGTIASGGLAFLITNHPLIGLLVGVVGFMMSAAALYDRYPPDQPPLLEG